MSVGENIMRIRIERGMSQVELAEKVGISQSMLCQVERCSKNPSLQLSYIIAQALGCTVNDFLSDKPA